LHGTTPKNFNPAFAIPRHPNHSLRQNFPCTPLTTVRRLVVTSPQSTRVTRDGAARRGATRSTGRPGTMQTLTPVYYRHGGELENLRVSSLPPPPPRALRTLLSRSNMRQSALHVGRMYARLRYGKCNAVQS